MSSEKAILDQAVRAALAPQPVQQLPPQQGVPPQLMLGMVQCKILTPKQGWMWFFKNVEPTEFYEPSEGETK